MYEKRKFSEGSGPQPKNKRQKRGSFRGRKQQQPLFSTKEDEATNAMELPGVVPLEDRVPEGHIPNEEFRVGG